MKMKRTMLAVGFCAILGSGLLLLVAARTSQAETENKYEELQLFTDVLAIVRHSYVDEVPMKTLIQGAINGMLAALDPHSSYMTPETFKEMQIDTSGEFGGVGIEISTRDDELVVVAPLEDTPAARAGILAGDRIVKIDDRFTRDLVDVMEAVRMMRGERGSVITLTIMRDNFDKPREFPLTRELIKLRSVKSQLLEPGYGYLRLAQFQESTSAEMEKALGELRVQNQGELSGLVLDLRNNPGGLLDQAVAVSDLFLTSGLIVYTEGREAGSKMQFAAHQKGTEPAYPVIVLINNGSASASEIVAGALQDQGRAVILGTQSFGKGSVQTIIPLRGESGLRLTTARYFTPKGRSIQASGIVPDIMVPAMELKVAAVEPHQFREKDLRNHFETKSSASDAATGKAAKPDQALKAQVGNDDYQLVRALDLLKGWKILKGLGA